MAPENPTTQPVAKDLDPPTPTERRKKRRESPVMDRDGVEVMPRYRRRKLDLKSLSGTARESARRYREWSEGKIDRDSYLVAVKGLSEHRGNLLALEQERQREAIDRMDAQLCELREAPILPAYQPPHAALAADLPNVTDDGEAAQ